MSFEDQLRAILKEALQPVVDELRLLRGVQSLEKKRKGVSVPSPDAKLLDLASSARVLSVSDAHLRGLIRRGQLQSVRLGRRVLLRRTDLDQLLINGVPPG